MIADAANAWAGATFGCVVVIVFGALVWKHGWPDWWCDD